MQHKAGVWPCTPHGFIQLYCKLHLICQHWILQSNYDLCPCRRIALSTLSALHYLFFPWCSTISNIFITIKTSSVTVTFVAHWCWCNTFWFGRVEQLFWISDTWVEPSELYIDIEMHGHSFAFLPILSLFFHSLSSVIHHMIKGNLLFHVNMV